MALLSLRFLDNEEIMLFSFPQDNYRDGMLIEKSGNPNRLSDYKIVPLGWTEAGGNKFSYGWKLEIPRGKDQECDIIPKIDNQLNLFYFGLPADIKDKSGNVLGYCAIELLPGVYNKNNPLKAFEHVK